MRYWLMKSEPSDVSVDDVAAMPKQTVPWYGVRNFQARNYMDKEMEIGDGVLFYHSSCPEPGIVGFAEVASEAYPDATQFDPKSHYFDEKSKREKPRWKNVDVHPVEEDAPARPRRNADDPGAGDDARAAKERQSAVDHAGERGRVASP